MAIGGGSTNGLGWGGPFGGPPQKHTIDCPMCGETVPADRGYDGKLVVRQHDCLKSEETAGSPVTSASIIVLYLSFIGQYAEDVVLTGTLSLFPM